MPMPLKKTQVCQWAGGRWCRFNAFQHALPLCTIEAEYLPGHFLAAHLTIPTKPSLNTEDAVWECQLLWSISTNYHTPYELCPAGQESLFLQKWGSWARSCFLAPNPVRAGRWQGEDAVTHPGWVKKQQSPTLVLKKETAMFQHLMFLKYRNRDKFRISFELISMESLCSFLSLKSLVASCSQWSGKALAVASSQGSLSIIRRTKSLAENILKAWHYCSALRNICLFGWGKEYFLEVCTIFFQLLDKIGQFDFCAWKKEVTSCKTGC